MEGWNKLTVLSRRHRSSINIHVWVNLDSSNLEARSLEQETRRRGWTYSQFFLYKKKSSDRKFLQDAKQEEPSVAFHQNNRKKTDL
jgi:hypothetical protein